MALDVTSREQVDNVMTEAVKQLGGLESWSTVRHCPVVLRRRLGP